MNMHRLSISFIPFLASWSVVNGELRGKAMKQKSLVNEDLAFWSRQLKMSAELETECPLQETNVPDNKPFKTVTMFNKNDNACAGKKLSFPNIDCVHTEGPQAGSNVTKGFQGEMEVDFVPLKKSYWQNAMCPVNVHWHLGTEHYSKGEYDEDGDGKYGNIDAPEFRRLKEDVRPGFRCHHYDKDDKKFNEEYDWKHCEGMHVGETYEVHWPHSAVGACGTVDQYQTPFYDGVFCNIDAAGFGGLAAQDLAFAVGVQAQIYTVVNDEAYFYPDMMRGWIMDKDFAKDIAYYTGSTTGTSRDNKKCSAYNPITWQVDRKCHMISASSFDKLCYDMKNQRDDMSDDLHAHGSRELVNPKYNANNHEYNRKLRSDHDHDHHDHDHHDHDHAAWF